VGNRRAKDPKKRALCLRLTEKQFAILQLYAEVKGFSTEVDALRHIVDGLEGWLKQQDADVDDEPTPTAVPAIS
jgi:hypothetical protein